MLSRTVKIHRKRICGPKISIAKKTSTVLGFDGGGLSLDTQYNGTVVGIDLYQKDNTTAGAAIAYADGNSSSSDGGAYTRNDATYLGASLYGLKDLGGYRLAADLSYVGGSHDIIQYNAGKVITAKLDTWRESHEGL